jgi:hypothetical protein
VGLCGVRFVLFSCTYFHITICRDVAQLAHKDEVYYKFTSECAVGDSFRASRCCSQYFIF